MHCLKSSNRKKWVHRHLTKGKTDGVKNMTALYGKQETAPHALARTKARPALDKMAEKPRGIKNKTKKTCPLRSLMP
jgi:hypothetical protein